MSISSTQTFLPQQITSVDVCAQMNIAGSYFNGDSNDGVGAVLTSTGPTIIIDGISLTIGMRVLLPAQTDNTQNGIYVYNGSGIFTRAQDFQCAEQIKPGYFIFVSLGEIAKSFNYVVNIGPSKVGFDTIRIVSSSTVSVHSSALTIAVTSTVIDIPGVTVDNTVNATIYSLTTPSSIVTALATDNDEITTTFTVAPGANTVVTFFIGAAWS